MKLLSGSSHHNRALFPSVELKKKKKRRVSRHKHKKKLLKLITLSPRGPLLKLQQLARCLLVLPGEGKVAGVKAHWRQRAQTNVHWQTALSLQFTNRIFKQRLAQGLQGWMLSAPRELLDLPLLGELSSLPFHSSLILIKQNGDV